MWIKSVCCWTGACVCFNEAKQPTDPTTGLTDCGRFSGFTHHGFTRCYKATAGPPQTLSSLEGKKTKPKQKQNRSVHGCLLAVQYIQQLICDLINFTYWLLRWEALICEGFIRVWTPSSAPSCSQPSCCRLVSKGDQWFISQIGSNWDQVVTDVVVILSSQPLQRDVTSVARLDCMRQKCFFFIQSRRKINVQKSSSIVVLFVKRDLGGSVVSPRCF